MNNLAIFDASFFNQNNSRFWLEETKEGTRLFRGNYRPLKNTSDDIQKISQIFKDNLHLIQQMDVSEADILSTLASINGIIEKHNQKIIGCSSKALNWLVHLPIVCKIMGLFLDIHSFDKKMTPYKAITAAENLFITHSIQHLPKIAAPTIDPETIVPLELFSETRWDTLKSRMEVVEEKKILSKPIKNLGVFVILRNPATNQMTRWIIYTHKTAELQLVSKTLQDWHAKLDFNSPPLAMHKNFNPPIQVGNEFVFSLSACLFPEVERDLTEAVWKQASSRKQNAEIICECPAVAHIFIHNDSEYDESPLADVYFLHMRETMRKNWTQEQINHRFEQLLRLRKKEKRNSQGPDFIHWGSHPLENIQHYKYADWLIRIMSPLVTKLDPNLLTPEDFLDIPAYHNFNDLVMKCLEDPKLVQSEEASYALRMAVENENYPLALAMLRAGVKDRNFEDKSPLWNRSLAYAYLEKTALFKLFEKNTVFGRREPNLAKFKHLLPEIFYRLLKDNGNPNAKQDKLGATILETVYLSKNCPRPLKLQFIAITLDLGASIHPLQMERFRADMEKGDIELAKLLLSRKRISKEDYDSYAIKTTSSNNNDPTVLLADLTKAKHEATKALRKSNIAHDALDFPKLSHWRQLKKDAKKKLEDKEWKASCSAPLLEKLQAARADFNKTYDQLHNRHPLLSTLRFVSQDIRGLRRKTLEDVNNRLIKMIALWSDPSHEKLNHEQIKSKIQNDPHLYEGIYQRVTKAAERYFQDPFWYACRNLWVHGTKLPTVLMMKKTKEKELLGTGTLLKKNIAPMCGEVCGSEVNINKDKLSGEILSSSWNDEEMNYMNAGTKLLTSVLYASNTKYYKFHHMVFDPEETLKRITPTVLDTLLCDDGPSIYTWSLLRLDILRLRMTDPEAAQKLKPLKEHAQEKFQWYKQLSYPSSNIDSLQKILDVIEKPVPIFLDQNDLEALAKPYPILLGCPDKHPELHLGGRPPRAKNYMEYLLSEGLTLGRDIKMAFTDKLHLPQLQELLAGEDVRVEEYDMAYMLETMEMIRGSAIKSKDMDYATPAEAQKKLGELLQRDVLPSYAAKLPDKPYYLKNGKFKPVAQPLFSKQARNYEEYRDKVEQSEIVPRDIHGCMHSARTTLWTQVLAALGLKNGKIVGNLVRLGITGGKHDTARRDESVDVYEKESADEAEIYFNRYQLPENIVKKYKHCIEHKDPKDDIFADPEHEIVHDADCLEILRLMGLDRFESLRLCFNKWPSLTPEYKAELIKEIKAFIDQTEDIEVKKQLEWYSDEYYLDLLRLLKKTHEEKQCYSKLYEIIKDWV